MTVSLDCWGGPMVIRLWRRGKRSQAPAANPGSNTEISLANGRVVAQRRGVAGHPDAADIEDHRTARDFERPARVLLRQQHGKTFACLDFAQDLADPLDDRRREPE